jgi:hypothetical protein
MVYNSNGEFRFFQGSTAATGLTIQGGQVTGGSTLNWNMPGPVNVTGSNSGVKSTVPPTSVSTNNNSPCWNFWGGVWNGTTNTPGFSGPCLQSVAVNPTPAGQIAQAYLTLQPTASASVGLDLRNAVLPFHMGTTADVTNLNILSANGLTVQGVAIPDPPTHITTASIGGSPLAAGACTSTTNTVSGVFGSTHVYPTPIGGGPGPGFIPYAWGSSSNTITTEVCAIVAGTPAANSYDLEIHF